MSFKVSLHCQNVLHGDVMMAADGVNKAQEVANTYHRPVVIKNYGPGKHSHGSVYLTVQPNIDTPMFDEIYGG